MIGRLGLPYHKTKVRKMIMFYCDRCKKLVGARYNFKYFPLVNTDCHCKKLGK